jgi:peptidoglycan/xylan/chitin deacetylase (PgdA/CDA1 family)
LSIFSNYYFVKTPWVIAAWYGKQVWKINTHEPVIFLTFDDGPHPEHTPKVLEILDKYQAKASFFCIGKNAKDSPDILNQIIEAGHVIGNHTQNHLNGWKTSDQDYLYDIYLAKKQLGSHLFRPPYGRIKKSQTNQFLENNPGAKIIMWSVLSGDFDLRLTPEQCARKVSKHLNPGHIFVFHDSQKASSRMFPALLKLLEEGKRKGFRFEALTPEWLNLKL